MMGKTTTLLLLLVIFAGGCSARIAPTSAPALDAREAIAVLAMREAAVKTLSGEGSVTLSRANGQSVSLATAVVLSLPDRARLRAWKMGQAVFDLTITPEGVWVLVADKNRREEILPAGKNAAQFMRSLSWIQGSYFSAPDLVVLEETPGIFRLQRMEQDTRIVATIDRSTLHVQRFEIFDAANVRRAVLEFSKHRRISGTVWPMKMRTTSEQGTIEVDLDAVELNATPAQSAFVAPRRAEKLQ